MRRSLVALLIALVALWPSYSYSNGKDDRNKKNNAARGKGDDDDMDNILVTISTKRYGDIYFWQARMCLCRYCQRDVHLSYFRKTVRIQGERCANTEDSSELRMLDEKISIPEDVNEWWLRYYFKDGYLYIEGPYLP